MTVLVDIFSAVLLLTGAYFFTTGTIGLLRFPDVRSQLHALTKADNLGLGLILLAVALQVGSWPVATVLLATWLLALGAASVSAQVIAGLQRDLNRSELKDDVEDSPVAGIPAASDDGQDHPAAETRKPGPI